MHCRISCYHSRIGLPKKRVKTEELSTISLGYMMNKRPNKGGENKRLRVLVDSGCGATLINKKFVEHWRKWSTKAGSFKTTRKCKIRLHYQPFTQMETSIERHMWMNHHLRLATTMK